MNRYFDRIFRAATRRLMDVFGIQVEQVTDKSNVSYILINTLDDTPLRPDRPLENDITNGLLLPVLAVIFMSDNEVKEGTKNNLILNESVKSFNI